MAGFYTEHYRARRQINQAVDQMVSASASSATLEAARALKTLDLIQSGRSDAAIKLLCTPIANFYYLYDYPTDRDQLRRSVRALIDELIKTNKLVAEQMKLHSTNYPYTAAAH